MECLNAREVALRILYKIDVDKAYIDIALDNSLRKTKLEQYDRRFVSELVHGVIRWKLTIDYIIEQFSQIKFNKISLWILNILRLGIYQIMFMDKIPASAACNESVQLSKKYGHSASVKFVNGILRNIERNKHNIQYPDIKTDKIKHLSVKYSFPEWMVRRWLERYGEDFTADFMRHSNGVPPLTIRVNSLKISRNKLKDMLSAEGFVCSNAYYADNAMVLQHTGALTDMHAFNAGYFQPQDESSMLAVQILDPKQNETIMDVCAAPGGKAAYIAELMNNKGLVIGRDIYENKIRLVEKLVKRLEIDIVRTQVHDALVIDESMIGKADRVIIDAPCTGFGIIRRKPDIKWHRTESQSNEIINIQQKMLDVCSRYVKPGGVIVYSTCTIEPAENVEMFKKFIQSHPEFYPIDFTDILPRNFKKQTAASGYIQLYPNTDKTDGFFIAKARRK